MEGTGDRQFHANGERDRQCIAHSDTYTHGYSNSAPHALRYYHTSHE